MKQPTFRVENTVEKKIVLGPDTVTRMIELLTNEETIELAKYCRGAVEVDLMIRMSDWLMQHFNVPQSLRQVQ